MFWIWYLRIMGLLYIIGVAVGTFRVRSFEIGSVELIGETFMVGSLLSEQSAQELARLGVDVGSMEGASANEFAVFVVRLWNLIIRTIPGVVLIALGEGLAAVFYIERRLRQRAAQKAMEPAPPSPRYGQRPRSSIPQDWR